MGRMRENPSSPAEEDVARERACGERELKSRCGCRCGVPDAACFKDDACLARRVVLGGDRAKASGPPIEERRVIPVTTEPNLEMSEPLRVALKGRVILEAGATRLGERRVSPPVCWFIIEDWGLNLRLHVPGNVSSRVSRISFSIAWQKI